MWPIFSIRGHIILIWGVSQTFIIMSANGISALKNENENYKQFSPDSTNKKDR